MISRLITKKRVVLSLLILIVVVCISVVLIVMVGTKENTCDYNCSLQDINNNEKFGAGVYFDAMHKNMSDQMRLFLYFDHELSDDEILQVEQIGLEINNESWLPTQSGGFYSGKCKVEDICKLACLDIIKRVTSAEGTMESLD